MKKAELKKMVKEELNAFLNEKESKPKSMLAKDIVAFMIANIRNASRIPSAYRKDYIKSMTDMARRKPQDFAKDYGKFKKSDWIEDITYNLQNEGKLTEANFYISSKKGLLKSSGSNWKKPQVFRSYKDAEKYISGEKAYWVSDDKGNKVNKYGEVDEGLTEGKYDNKVSEKFKSFLDNLPEKKMTPKNVQGYAKASGGLTAKYGLAYAMDAFGWMKYMKEGKISEAAPRMRKDPYVEKLRALYQEVSKLDNQMKSGDSSRYSHVKKDFHKALKGINQLAGTLRVKGATIPN